MVKFTFGDIDKRTLGLGLSRININKIIERMPILIRSPELKQLMDWKGEILIMYSYRTNFKADEGNEKIFVIGFNKISVDCLKKGEIIKIESSELEEIMGWKGSILIMYGDTEKDIKEKLSEFFTENTKIIDKKKDYENERRRFNDLGLP